MLLDILNDSYCDWDIIIWNGIVIGTGIVRITYLESGCLFTEPHTSLQQAAI